MESTKVFVDSINAVVKLSPEILAPKQEWYSNWDDVAIIATICLAISITTIKCLEKYFEHIKSRSTDEWNHVSQRREWDIDDKNRKRVSELLDMKLSFQKEFCYNHPEVKSIVDGKETTKKEKVLKSSDDADVQKYIENIGEAIDKLKYNTNEQNKLVAETQV